VPSLLDQLAAPGQIYLSWESTPPPPTVEWWDLDLGSLVQSTAHQNVRYAARGTTIYLDIVEGS
jgi:hypothetical protein